MSRFFDERLSRLVPYTPGEQPQDMQYVKLNTNESPFPPSPVAARMAREEAGRLYLYSDPTCGTLCEAAADAFGVSPDEVIFGNGSDEILNFAFIAFCGKDRPAAFPDVTYGFYPVFAELNGVGYEEIPLSEDLRIIPSDYFGLGKTVFIANPNAPTGIALSAAEIESIVKSNENSVVVVDEAYVDFGAESCRGLINRYGNLLVVGTFSKSRSLAGGRLGFGLASKELIADLNAVRYSINPYNVNRMTMAAGVGALRDTEYFEYCRSRIISTRKRMEKALVSLGFTCTDSSANFIFARHRAIGGEELYLKLKEKGVLVRHFGKERIKDYVRITVGSDVQADALIAALESITGGAL
ncbi:MAG: histidinol-phosphate transaminase [Clostridia bacterium]|nr:histidinol-phosphate transaminase [Clostridia bacterium]